LLIMWDSSKGIEYAYTLTLSGKTTNNIPLNNANDKIFSVVLISSTF
jgi:hypothetical protein